MYNNYIMNNLEKLNKLKVGDKLVLKNKKKVPEPLLSYARNVEGEFKVQDVKTTYATISFKGNKEYAEENDGLSSGVASFHGEHIWNWFKLSK